MPEESAGWGRQKQTWNFSTPTRCTTGNVARGLTRRTGRSRQHKIARLKEVSSTWQPDTYIQYINREKERQRKALHIIILLTVEILWTAHDSGSSSRLDSVADSVHQFAIRAFHLHTRGDTYWEMVLSRLDEVRRGYRNLIKNKCLYTKPWQQQVA